MRPLILAVCWYAVPGFLWVVASDWAVAALVGDPLLRAQISAVKGIVFVGITGAIVYRLLARQQAARDVVEAAYTESERGFQLLFKNNPLPVWAYDRGTLRFLEINDVALVKYGYSRDELLAMQVTDLHPPEEVPRLLDAIATPRQVRETSGVWHHRLKDGRIIEVEVQVHDLEFHGRAARVVVGLDVTERRRAEQRFRELVEGLEAIAWEADPATHRFTFVGQRAESMLGYPLADWTSGEDILVRCLSESDLEKARAYLSAVANGRAGIPCEVRARAADGRVIWLRVEGAAHIDETGLARHLRGLIADVTGEHDRAERVARGEKLRALGQLSSGVAHDLNQSLALIAGYGELLQASLLEQPVAIERVREMADVMVRAASDGGETVRRMLTFVRSSPDEALVPVDLASLIQEVARLTAPRWRDASQAEGRPIELTVEIEGDAVIRGSASSLREALTNLVLNAVDALPDGGTIGLSTAVIADRAYVRVADSGIGMSDDVRARIFEPFFTTKGDRGTGLGLPTVFGIVEAHGGEVTVRSEPGRGTAFELGFPRSERFVAPVPAHRHDAPTDDAPLVASLHCLIVDDQPQLARMLSAMVCRLGHVVQTAYDGDEALRVLASEPIDVLLTDVGMGPIMNGWELAERALVLYPGLPVILATGWGASIDPDEARERGIVGVLSKPFRQADLVRVLSSIRTYPRPDGLDSPPPPRARAS